MLYVSYIVRVQCIRPVPVVPGIVVGSHNLDTYKPKYRNYDGKCLDLNFTYDKINNDQRSRYVICLKMLSIESMLPNQPSQRMETLHSNVFKQPKGKFVFARK